MTLESGWFELEEALTTEDMTPEILRKLKTAYYSGALMITLLLTDRDLTKEETVAKMLGFRDEMTAFIKSNEK